MGNGGQKGKNICFSFSALGALITSALIILWALYSFSDKTLLVVPVVCAVFHETGHIVSSLLLHLKIDRIRIYPFGADIKFGGGLLSYKNEFVLLSSGVCANLLFAGVSFFVYLRCGFPVCLSLVVNNLSYAFLNVLPIRNLDGGRLFENLLLRKTAPDKAYSLCSRVSFITLFFLYSVATLVFFYTSFNFTLLFFCMYLFVTTVFLTD